MKKMNSNKIFIRYLGNRAVGVNTAALYDVDDLIVAYKSAVTPFFDQISIHELTLHFMPSSGEEINYDSHTLLTFLGENGRDGSNPLIIKSKTNPESFISTTHQILETTFPTIIEAPIRSSGSTTMSISKKYPMPSPLRLKEWSVFSEDVLECVKSIPDEPLKNRLIRYDPIPCSGELGVQSIADHSVFRYLKSLMETLKLLSKFRFLTSGEFASIEGRGQVFGNPDRIWAPTGYSLSKLVVEFKTPWALGIGEGNIIELYNEESKKLKTGKLKEKGKVMRSIEQTYVYMTLNRHRYGCFTTFDKTWFLRKVEDPLKGQASSQLEISPVILCNSNNPITLTKAWMYLLLTIEGDANWLYSSPLSSAVTSPSKPKSTRMAENDRYECLCLDSLMHWKDIIGRSQAGAVAIGTFRHFPNVVFKTIDISKIKGAQQQFDHEVRMYKHMASLQGKHIPTLIAYGNLGGLIQVIVLEHVGKHITYDQFQARKTDIEAALDSIHSLNVKHGDLRLPNITIDSANCIRIIDFGMSSFVDGITEEIEEIFIL